MPMKTTLVSRATLPLASRRWQKRLVDDLAIREVAPKPSSPVAQNGQPTAQPAWLEMHSVRSREASPRRVAHQDRLHEPPVVEVVERLLGQAAVRLAGLGVDERVEAEVTSSSSRSGSGRVWMVVGEVGPTAPEVVGDLARAIRRLPRGRARSATGQAKAGERRGGGSLVNGRATADGPETPPGAATQAIDRRAASTRAARRTRRPIDAAAAGR